MGPDPSLLAFSIQAQLERYGAYLGIAAFLGLTVLILLYFAQARELKRLRDWVGDAPERDRELEEYRRERAAAPGVPNRVVAPTPAQERPRVVAQPVVAPMTAAAAKAGVVPGAPGAATDPPTVVTAGSPAAGPVKPGIPTVTQGPLGGSQSLPSNPAPGAAVTAGEKVPPPLDPGAPTSSGVPAAGPSVVPQPAPSSIASRPGVPAPAAAVRASVPVASPKPTSRNQPQRSASGRTAVPPRGGATVAPAHRRRRAVVATLVLIGLVGGGAFAYSQLGKDEQSAPAVATKATTASATKKPVPETRSQTTVTVLNGTTVTGLAQTVSDRLFSSGFGRGSTGNNTDQQRAASLVLYGATHRAQAIEVGKILKISDVRPIDPDTQGLAGDDAEVVVVVGSDQAP